jgi:hypothetical protein
MLVRPVLTVGRDHSRCWIVKVASSNYTDAAIWGHHAFQESGSQYANANFNDGQIRR